MIFLVCIYEMDVYCFCDYVCCLGRNVIEKVGVR